MANWNPHVHALVTDACWDSGGNFYPIPEIGSSDIQGIVKLFEDLVFKMLLEEYDLRGTGGEHKLQEAQRL